MGSILLLSILGFILICQTYSQVDWKDKKFTHYNDVQPLVGRTEEDMDYFANILMNEENFKLILKQVLIERTVGSPGHEHVRQFITGFMSQLDWTVEEQSFNDSTPLGPKNFTNIIATLNPLAPRRLVLACHYDSKLTPEGFLGATDSAVPCSQMMNLAYVMKLNLQEHTRTNTELSLSLLFLDGEEAFVQWTDTDSIYGSRKLANAWNTEGYKSNEVSGNYLDRIDMFVLLDLIGEKDPTFFLLKDSTKDWFKTLVKIESQLSKQGLFNDAYRKKMFVDIRGPNGIEDDHVPFEEAGVPILHLITYPFPTEWHKIGDNGANIDFSSVENLNKILRVFVAEYLDLA